MKRKTWEWGEHRGKGDMLEMMVLGSKGSEGERQQYR
jgi:hypothetical protein